MFQELDSPSAEALSSEEEALLSDVGYARDGARVATSVLADRVMRTAYSNDENVVLIPLAEALSTYDFVQDLMFGLVSPEANDHVREAAEQLDGPVGHFLWVKPGAKLTLPVQNFTLFETPQARQFTHDITLIDAGAEVEIIAGTAVPSAVHAGRHISISETYLRPGAACTSVEIEHWGERMEVFSYNYSLLEAGARSTATSVNLAPVRSHTNLSHSVLGADANEVEQAIVFAPQGTTRIVETETELREPGARSESLARMVSAGGTIHNRAHLIGGAPNTNGFLGCDGLKLGEQGEILAVPSLLAKVEGAQLSHEASVGMVSAEKVAYLTASGISEDTARDLIVQGFLDLNRRHIPPSVRRRVENMVAAAKSGGM